MVYDQAKLVSEISSYKKFHSNKPNCDWYVGIASDPRRRLFDEHGVQERGDWWIIREAASDMVARAAEQELLDLGFDGGPGGGDKSTVYVYAYEKSGHTRE